MHEPHFKARYPARTEVVEGYFYKRWDKYFGSGDDRSVYRLKTFMEARVRSSNIFSIQISLHENPQVRNPVHGEKMYILGLKTDGKI